jgi:hypothetical protein
MSRRLGAFALILGILVCSMGLKTALSGNHTSSAVMVANGPDPVPPYPAPAPPQTPPKP